MRRRVTGWRWLALPAAGLLAALAGVLVFGNLNDNLVYYLTPSEAQARQAELADGRRLRLGGLVEAGSARIVPGGVAFTVTDGTRAVQVTHQGAPPQLFRGGIGVIVEGALTPGGFRSDVLLVNHDETYRPPGPGDQLPSARVEGER